MIVTIIVFLLVLGILIFVHEAGHFMTARRNGITCHEFGFGFPPRIGGVYRDATTGRWKLVLGNKEYLGNKTLYSINWIPLGGFVRIKGEDGRDKDPDSFAVQSHWVRFKVLIAGVVMNFILAWVLISIVLMIGATETTDRVSPYGKIVSSERVQINAVEEKSPAEDMGLVLGDVVTEVCDGEGCTVIDTADTLIATVNGKRGEMVEVRGFRGNAPIIFEGVLRPEGDSGALGVSIGETVIVKYPWYIALWEGLVRTLNFIIAIFVAFGSLIMALITGQGAGGTVTGPVGIAEMTGQMKQLGIAALLQFSAILSINLGIINALPIPALDGGRILFLVIEKIKGRPVDQKVEGYIHGISFMLLIILMLFITAKDVLRFF